MTAHEHAFLTDQRNVVLELFDVSEDEVGEVDLGNLDVGVGRPHDELLLLRRDLRHLVLGADGNGGAHVPVGGGLRITIMTFLGNIMKFGRFIPKTFSFVYLKRVTSLPGRRHPQPRLGPAGRRRCREPLPGDEGAQHRRPEGHLVGGEQGGLREKEEEEEGDLKGVVEVGWIHSCTVTV